MSTPSTRTARSHDRWFSPTCSSSTRSHGTARSAASLRCMPMATLHSPRARCPPSRSAWVTIPTGLVKSTNQAPGAPRRAVSSASSITTGTVRRALAKPPGPVVSWPMQPNLSGRVSSLNRASCPPTRICTTTKEAPSRARSRSVVRTRSPLHPCRARIRRETPPTTSRRSRSTSSMASSSTGNRSPCATNPSTSSGVYVLPAPTTATFRPTETPPLPRDAILGYSSRGVKPLGEFPDRFLEEISAQPEAMRRAARELDRHQDELGRIGFADPPHSVVFTGMGASYAACYSPVTVLAGHGIQATMVDAAELLHFRRRTVGRDDVLVVVSITNGLDNPLAAGAVVSLDTGAGPELGPSTLSYAASLVILSAVSERLAGSSAVDAVRTVWERVERAARTAAALLERPELQAGRFREWLGRRPVVALLGRGTARAASEVGALVLKEAAQVPAEAMESAQFRHGPLELAGPDLAAAIVATKPETASLDRGLADELAGAGTSVLLIEQDAGVFARGDAVAIGDVDRSLAPAVAAIPFQLAAWRVATDRGLPLGVLTIASKVTTRE